MHDPGFDLTGKRAVVTGASAGIGGAIAARLAAAGATVVAVSRGGGLPPLPFGDEAAAARLHAISADLSDAAQVDTVIARAVEVLGGLDILVNNAGRGDWKPLAELDRAYFDGLIGLNLWAPLRLCQLAHPHLAATATDGPKRDSAVVMIGSVDAVRPSAGGAVYGASKAGLAAMTVALAKEWRDDGIRVTQVDPGMVDTPMAASVVQELKAAGVSINIAGRAGEGDEIAGLVQYLVAPVGRFATGVSFRLDGGAVALGPFDMRGR